MKLFQAADPNHMSELSPIFPIGMGGAAIAPPTSLVEKDKERKYTQIPFSKTERYLFLSQSFNQLTCPVTLPIWFFLAEEPVLVL